MGRYIYGDFDYKFAFAEQSSSFGEVLEEILSQDKEEDNFVERFISNTGNGEIVELTILEPKKFKRFIKEYIKPLNDLESDSFIITNQQRHDMNMMKLFLKNVNDSQQNYHFRVDY